MAFVLAGAQTPRAALAFFTWIMAMALSAGCDHKTGAENLEDVRANATSEYWQSMVLISERMRELAKPPRIQPGWQLAQLRRTIPAVKNLRSELETLPTANVGFEATEFASYLSECMANLESLFAKTLASQEDDETALNTAIGQDDRLTPEMIAALREMSAAEIELNFQCLTGWPYSGDETAIRTSLCRKYHREFPTLR